MSRTNTVNKSVSSFRVPRLTRHETMVEPSNRLEIRHVCESRSSTSIQTQRRDPITDQLRGHMPHTLKGPTGIRTRFKRTIARARHDWNRRATRSIRDCKRMRMLIYKAIVSLFIIHRLRKLSDTVGNAFCHASAVQCTTQAQFATQGSGDPERG